MANQVRTDFIINEGDSARKIHDFSAHLKDLESEMNNLGKNTSFARDFTENFDKLEKQTNSLRTSFASVAATRLDGGQVGNLTKEIVRASERSRQLSLDMLNIKNELANPNRKSSIKFLTDELKAAEKEADSLNRKLATVKSAPTAGSTGGKSGGKASGGGRGRITGEQAALLEILDDFAPAGLNKPFNSVARGALIAGDIKEAAAGIQVAGKEMLALVGISGTALATFGAIAAVGYGIVKVTQNIREEAERRLKVENEISAVVNRQIIGQREGLQNLQKEREELQRNREFGRDLASSSVEDLQRKKASLEKLQNLTPAILPVIENGKVVSKPNEDFLKNAERLKAFDAQIDQLRQKNINADRDAYNQSATNAEKSRNNRLESEKRFQDKLDEYNKKRNDDIDKAKKKVEELGKQYNATFQDLFAKSSNQNPFASIFTEADKSLRTLKENIKGLPKDLQAAALGLQSNITNNQLFSSRLDNKLDTFDLRERASELRNFKPVFDQSQADEIARRNINRGNFNQIGGTFGSNLANSAGGFDKLNDAQKRDIYQTSLLSQPSFTNQNPDAFTAGNQNSLISSLAGEQLRGKNPDENLSIQQRLDKQLNIINSLGAKTPEELASADRKALSLSSNLRPEQLTNDERNKLATINEREAVRRENYERTAQKYRQDQTGYLKNISEYVNAQKAAVQKGGSSAITITVKDETDGGVDSSLPTKAKSEDTQREYRFNQFEYQGGR